MYTIGQNAQHIATSPWIRKYIFTVGCITLLSEIIREAEKLNIDIIDIEVLRMHFAFTLDHWYKRVINNKNSNTNMHDKRFFIYRNFIY